VQKMVKKEKTEKNVKSGAKTEVGLAIFKLLVMIVIFCSVGTFDVNARSTAYKSDIKSNKYACYVDSS